jgi:hypothetical protein
LRATSAISTPSAIASSATARAGDTHHEQRAEFTAGHPTDHHSKPSRSRTPQCGIHAASCSICSVAHSSLQHVSQRFGYLVENLRIHSRPVSSGAINAKPPVNETLTCHIQPTMFSFSALSERWLRPTPPTKARLQASPSVPTLYLPGRESPTTPTTAAKASEAIRSLNLPAHMCRYVRVSHLVSLSAWQ